MKIAILEVHIRNERNLRIVKYSTPVSKRQLIFLTDRGIVGERNPPCPVDLLAALVLVLVHHICTIVFACGELFNCLRLCCLGPTASGPQDTNGAGVTIAAESTDFHKCCSCVAQ